MYTHRVKCVTPQWTKEEQIQHEKVYLYSLFLTCFWEAINSYSCHSSGYLSEKAYNQTSKLN